MLSLILCFLLQDSYLFRGLESNLKPQIAPIPRISLPEKNPRYRRNLRFIRASSVISDVNVYQDPLRPVKVPLPDAARHSPTFSPDGAWVYFFQQKARPESFGKFARSETLCRVRPDGKGSQEIVEIGDTIGRLFWTPDGKRLLLVRRTDDTNGDGKIDARDGDSLWSAGPDGKDSKTLIAPSPKYLTVYAVTPQGSIVLGYRDRIEAPEARIVVRDPTGKERDLAKAWAYYPLDGDSGFLRLAASKRALEGKLVRRRLDADKGEPFDARHVVVPPIRAHGKLWYARLEETSGDKRVDHNDRAALAICDATGRNHRRITQGLRDVLPRFPWADGVLCLVLEWSPRGFRTGAKLAVVAESGVEKHVWSPVTGWIGLPAVSRDGRMVAFGVTRDSSGDGKVRAWEDATDLYVAERK